MTRIELKSKVGADGVLSVRVPVGAAQANREVRVTVEADDETPSGAPLSEPWTSFVTDTYGSCANLGLDEPDDLPLQERDWCR